PRCPATPAPPGAARRAGSTRGRTRWTVPGPAGAPPSRGRPPPTGTTARTRRSTRRTGRRGSTAAAGPARRRRRAAPASRAPAHRPGRGPPPPPAGRAAPAGGRGRQVGRRAVGGVRVQPHRLRRAVDRRAQRVDGGAVGADRQAAVDRVRGDPPVPAGGHVERDDGPAAAPVP